MTSDRPRVTGSRLWSFLNSLVLSNRDHRIDFFRGCALWLIFVDHIPGNVLRHVSLLELSYCDAAEVFVLLAGISAGIVYGRQLRKSGYSFAARRLVRRAGSLYRSHLVLFAVFACLVISTALFWGKLEYLDTFNLNRLLTDPIHSFSQALTLLYQPSYLDILPLYVVLLVLFTLGLRFLTRPLLLLGLSLALYTATRTLHVAFPLWMDGWKFDPFAWQLLFIIGAVVADAGIPRRRRRIGDVIAWPAFALIFVVYHAHHFAPVLSVLHLQAPDADNIDKVALHPMRLISVLLLAWIVWRAVPVGASWLRSRLAMPLLIMGQHSLLVFCVGVLLSFGASLVLAERADWVAQVVVNGVGAAGMLSFAIFDAWKVKRAKRAATYARDRLEAVGQRAA